MKVLEYLFNLLPTGLIDTIYRHTAFMTGGDIFGLIFFITIFTVIFGLLYRGRREQDKHEADAKEFFAKSSQATHNLHK